MSLRHLDFMLQETLTGIRRNAFMSLAAVTTIAASLLLLGAVRLTTQNLNQLATALGSRFEMHVFLRPETSKTERDATAKQLAALPGVANCRFIPKEEALPELCRRLQGAVDLSDLGGTNPLPDAFVLQVSDLTQMAAVAAAVRRLPAVDEVRDTHEAAETWASITRAIHAGGIVGVLLLVLAATVIVGNTIRLTVYARRLEIGIMQMVGATRGCIRTPFLLEGMLQGMAGAVLAMALLSAGYLYVHYELRARVPLLELLPPNGALLWEQFRLLVAVGVALGLAGSYWSIRKYLHV
ncbi:MAG: permease-like cell division protein FtsX [Armatimonadota bacterium]|nr:permease-like cell division protein FtsX [Armatimonadota bacterium]